MITQMPATGLWVTKGQVLVRENGTLRVMPVLSLRDNFTNERDAELYIASAAEEMIDKLLQNTNSGLQDSKYKNGSSETNIPEQQVSAPSCRTEGTTNETRNFPKAR
jgi:hypothetical protein